MSELPPLRFDDFELDEANARLTRRGTPIALPPKAFALLCALARSGGKLATKDALLDAVWGHRHVSESVLKTTIAQVRAALEDDAARPKYVETVARRGYRFIGRGDAASARPPTAAAPPAPVATTRDLPPLVARARALEHLRGSWQRATGGGRQLVWVAGDAGIGKSTLIDRFVAELGAEHVAYGQCVEQFGAGEPYLPVLEALKVLARRTPELVPLMRRVAPMWLVQMPWLVTDTDRTALQGTLEGASQERMVRELFELLERYTQERPLLLVTEDLHWSDRGTLKLMDHFARIRGPMRLLWLASFRLTQVIAEEHPLHYLRQELQLHRLCDELLLDPFSESELAEYVASRTAGRALPESFIRSLHEHTDGLPLFVVSVLEGVLPGEMESSKEWSGIGRELPVPESLAGAVEKQLAKLPAAERTVLEAASVCGVEFRGGTVADLLATSTGSVVAACDDLVRRRYWLREAGVVDLPDGSLDSSYAFRHAVYKHVFYQRLGAATRIAYHRRAARALARAGVLGTPATSAELASHYELGREYREAVVAYTAAADSAQKHFAPHETLHLVERGSALLPQCAAAERDELELPLVAMRGVAHAVINGIASPESLAAYERVSALCEILPETPDRAVLLNTLGWRYLTLADYAAAIAIAERIRSTGERFDDPVPLLFGYNLMGVAHANAGRFQEGRNALERGLSIYERAKPDTGARLYVDAATSMYANLALPLVQLGFADQSRASVAKAVVRAEEFGQPLARLVAYWCSCAVAIRLDDVEAAAASATRFDELAATGAAHQAAAPARWFRGWVELRRGRIDEGIAMVREGQRWYEESGLFASSTETLSYVVEGFVLAERWDEAQAALDEANAYVERLHERLFVAELRILEARIALGRNDAARARRVLEATLPEVREGKALGPELKLLTALAELPGATARDFAALGDAHGRLTEGFDTRPALRARELLAKRA